MKKILPVIAAALLAIPALAAKDKLADAETNQTPEQMEANYTKSIEGRTADILKVLALEDNDKAAKVHDIIIAQYRALRAWHDTNDVRLKTEAKDTNAVAGIRASLKLQHAEFISKLAENLTPEQVEQVKDKMTYGKVQFTLAGYRAAYPNLTGENQAKILELLKQAREEAMDGGSADEKTAIFQKCKGKINNYLSKQGIHPEKRKSAVDTATNAPAK